MAAAEARKRGFPIWTLLFVALLAAAAWWAFAPSENTFRRFDPDQVGRAEAAMWRAYYEARHADLARLAVTTERDTFGLSPQASARSGFAAANAARTFQASRSREQAQAALPQLTEHFRILAEATGAQFDPAEAARLELEWWQLRREDRVAGASAPAVAAATAYLYGIEPDRISRYAELRVEAMALRDRRGREITEADWATITETLIAAYRELAEQVVADA